MEGRHQFTYYVLLSHVLSLQVVPQVSVGTIECDVCELVVKYLDKFVDDNSTEVRSPTVFEISLCERLITLFLIACSACISQAQAEAAVEKLCDILGSKKNVCDNLVKEFFPQIWEMLVKEAVGDVECVL